MNSRLYLNALFELLRDYTDENHIISCKDLIHKLECEKGITMKEKKFYRSIDALIEKHLSISKYSKNRQGYYLIRKDDEISWCLLLCHILSSSTLLTEKQSKIAVEQILKPLSIYQRELFSNIVYLPLQKRQITTDWLPSIFTLHHAIKECCSITFKCLHFSDRKIPEIETGPFLVDPYFIVFNDSYTYLVGWNHEYNNYAHYRIDRIESIEITEDHYVYPSDDTDAYEYAKSKLSMFSGDTVPVTLHCKAKRNILDHMIDELGPNITIWKIDEETYEIHTKATIPGIVIFAQKYMDTVRIIEPAEARNKIIKNAELLLEYYQALKTDKTGPVENSKKE